VDPRVLIVASTAAAVTAMLCGLLPALQASRPHLTGVLRHGQPGATSARVRHRFRSTLLVVETALAVILLVGAGLFIGSFVQLMRIDPGFDYRHVLVFNVTAPRGQTGKFDEAMKASRAYVPQMNEAVRHVPGVVMAGTVSGGLPLTGSWSRTSVEIPGRGELEGDDAVDRRTVSPEYLQTLRIPLVRGRMIQPSDTESSGQIVVINEAAARKYWPGEDAIGKRVTISSTDRVVVGVVGDIRHLGPEQPARQEAYIPLLQDSSIGATLVIRTHGDPMTVLPAVKAAIWSVNPEQRLTGETVTLEGYMDRLIAQRRFNMALLALFGGLGLVIAAVGIYGVMAYIVAQRTNEIGIRMALGATRGVVVGMVLKRAALLMALGLVVGGGAAWTLSRNVETFLFQTEPTDPRIFVAALAVLTIAGLAASALPARRAASVDPLTALRHE
jgi:predicted permease